MTASPRKLRAVRESFASNIFPSPSSIAAIDSLASESPKDTHVHLSPSSPSGQNLENNLEGRSAATMTSKIENPNYRSTGPFTYRDEKQFVAVEDDRQTIRRRVWETKAIIEEAICPVSRCGCEIDEIVASPSGSWLVTQRVSGQGEWGYDVFRMSPLSREAGTSDADGYMIEIPTFAADEMQIVGGFGHRWLGGWWAHDDDDYYAPARGGLISFGFLLIHQLPSHQVGWHELTMELPKGWFPDDPEDSIWYGVREIVVESKIRMKLYGGVKFELTRSPPPVILLPTPHPSGNRLL